MGYRVYNGNSNFFIAKVNLAEVLTAIRVLPHGVSVSEIHQLFHLFGLDLSQDSDGNITDLFLLSNSLGDTQKAVLQAIAPFVRDGSYVMFIGEDAAQWAWVFRTKTETGIVEAYEEDVIPVLSSEYERFRAEHDEASS
jgi:hypothetical protein